MSFPIAPTPKPSAYDLEVEQLRAMPGAFAKWLELFPEPDLQKYAATYGGAGLMPAHVWTQFDAAMKEWRRRYADRPGGRL